MPELELHTRTMAKTAPACESGRHIVHPFYDCEDVDALAAAFAGLYEQALAEAYNIALTPTSEVPPSLLAGLRGEITDGVMATLYKAVDETVYGHRTGDMRGFLPARRDLTPAERAFAILEPHLHNVPLYRPRGRLLR